MTLSVLDHPRGTRESEEPDADLREVQIPQIPQIGTSGDSTPTIEDGVISDARRHARRRRTAYAVIAAAAALAMVGSAFAVFGGPSGDPTGAPEPGQPGALAAPVNPAEADVVGMWAKIHDGWVYVYDDGRVLSYPDLGPITERHLSPHGVDLVREGRLDPQLLLRPQLSRMAAEVWSDSSPQPYRPSAYAVCNESQVPDPDPDVLSDVGPIEAGVPEQVRVLLRAGHVQSFTDEFVDENGDFVGPDGYHSEPGLGVDCFVLGAAQTQAVWAHTGHIDGVPDGDNEFRASDTTFGTLNGTDGSEFVVVAIPIMPHGGWVLWGG